MSDIGIRIGAAGNQAAQMLHGIATRGDLTMDQISGFYAELVSNLVDVMNGLEAADQATAQVAAAFPGTTEVPASQFAVQAAPAVAAVPTVESSPNFQPVPPSIPTTSAPSGEEDLWKAFFANPGDWYDNRFNKKNPNGPDFKSKSIPDPGNPQYKAGLWISGKSVPAWVAPQLAQIGMGK